MISASVPDDLARRVEEAREEGESRSACLTRIIRDGLEADGDTRERQTIAGIPVVTIQSLALAAVVGAFGSFSRAVGLTGLAVLAALIARNAYLKNTG